jgi:hypothetical protein
VKLRPVEPHEVPDHLRRSPSTVVELDAMPGGYVCSASRKARLSGTTDVKRCVASERRISKLVSKQQRAFFAAHAPAGVELDDLTLRRAADEDRDGAGLLRHASPGTRVMTRPAAAVALEGTSRLAGASFRMGSVEVEGL